MLFLWLLPNSMLFLNLVRHLLSGVIMSLINVYWTYISFVYTVSLNGGQARSNTWGRTQLEFYASSSMCWLLVIFGGEFGSECRMIISQFTLLLSVPRFVFWHQTQISSQVSVPGSFSSETLGLLWCLAALRNTPPSVRYVRDFWEHTTPVVIHQLQSSRARTHARTWASGGWLVRLDLGSLTALSSHRPL